MRAKARSSRLLRHARAVTSVAAADEREDLVWPYPHLIQFTRGRINVIAVRMRCEPLMKMKARVSSHLTVSHFNRIVIDSATMIQPSHFWWILQFEHRYRIPLCLAWLWLPARQSLAPKQHCKSFMFGTDLPQRHIRSVFDVNGNGVAILLAR
jgi:hypothetical protein